MGESRLKKLLDDRDSGTPVSRIVRGHERLGRALRRARSPGAPGWRAPPCRWRLSELRRSGIVVEVPAAEDARQGRRTPGGGADAEPGGGHLRRRAPGAGRHPRGGGRRHAFGHRRTNCAARPRLWPRRGGRRDRSRHRAGLCRQRAALSGLLGVGVSVSAPVRPDGTVLGASILPTWADVNLRDVFGPALQRPIHADNESNCAALAEMMWGAAVGYEDFVLFKIDLGVGGAIVHGGRVLTRRRRRRRRVRPRLDRPRGRALPLRQPRLPRALRELQPAARGARPGARPADRHGRRDPARRAGRHRRAAADRGHRPRSPAAASPWSGRSSTRR